LEPDPDPVPVEVLVVGDVPPGSPTRIWIGAVVVGLEELHLVPPPVPVELLPDPPLLWCPLPFLEEPARVAWLCEGLWLFAEFDPVRESELPPVELVPGEGATDVLEEPPEDDFGAEMAVVVLWCWGACADGVDRTAAATSDTEPTTTPAMEPAAIPAGTRRRRLRRMA